MRHPATANTAEVPQSCKTIHSPFPRRFVIIVNFVTCFACCVLYYAEYQRETFLIEYLDANPAERHVPVPPHAPVPPLMTATVAALLKQC